MTSQLSGSDVFHVQLVWILTTKRKSVVESGEWLGIEFPLTMIVFPLVLDVSSVIKRFYSSDIHPFLIFSALNPDCSIHMNGRY